MKKLILFLFLLPLFVTAQIQMSQVSGLIPKFNSKQDSITRGTGFLKRTGLVWSYDNSTYLTSFTETDPIYSAWNKSTGISITKSQVSDFPTLFSGSYLDLTNKPTIPAAQVQTDWNATTGLGVLLNKPSSLPASDVYAWAKAFTKPTYTASEVGALSSGTSFRTVNSVSVVGSGDISINPFPGFGTGNGAAWGYSAHPTILNGYGITDAIQNQNSSAQSANIWINGQITTGTRSMFNSADDNIQLVLNRSNSNIGSGGIGANGSNYFMVTDVATGLTKFAIATSGAATFSSTVNSTGFLLNGNNLTSSLSTNYIPKWNGSSMVNSLISDDGTNILISGTQPFFKGGSNIGRFVVGNDNTTSYSIAYGSSHSTEPSTYEISALITKLFTNSVERLRIAKTGEVSIYSTTTSTSPTTGALVVGGGIGVGGAVNATSFNGSGSNLTGVQKPITLTTTGTSGAATFIGNTLNVPNYGSSATSGSYTPTISGSYASGFSNTASFYQNINGYYSVCVNGAYVTDGSNSNYITVTIPSTASGSIIGVGSAVAASLAGVYTANTYISKLNSTAATISIYWIGTPPGNTQNILFTMNLMYH